MKKVLTIAGSDSSGGAGIQADIKTIMAHGHYAMSVITSLTAQNTTGVSGIFDVSPEFVAEQADRVFEDIRPDSVKIGMVSTSALIEAVADRLRAHGAARVTLDPVMVATSGARLLSEDAVGTLVSRLMPLAEIITPNIPEAEILSGMTIGDRDGMIRAAEKIAENYSGAILIKGGHSVSDATDLLYEGGRALWIEGERVDNPNTHGTGCTLSSAIACARADDRTIAESVRRAKRFVSAALASMLDIGHGAGPLDHAGAARAIRRRAAIGVS